MALFVHDTFTGPLGLLTAHTGEIGASWSAPPGGSYNSNGLRDAQLDGSGALQLDYGTGRYAEDAIASGVPPGTDYYVEVDFTAYAGSTGNNDWITLYMRANGAYPNFIDVSLYPVQTAGGGRSEVYIGDALTGVFSSSIFGPVYGGAHTFRAEVEGSIARAYVDGALIGSFAVGTVLAGNVGFLFATDGPDISTGMVINEFRAGTLGVDAPTIFWTANVKTTEVA